MRHVLLDESMPFFKANMHCHTTNSDGKMTPEQIKAHYMANGYQIVAFTDHEHIIDNSHLNADGFLALTGCEIAIKEFKHLSSGKARDMKVCHLNLYAKDPHNVDTPCYSIVADHFLNPSIMEKIVHSTPDYDRTYSHEGISEIIAEANRRGFLVSYNHPRWSLENARDYLGYEGLWAMELYNHGSWVDGYQDYNVHAYEDFLRDGKRIGCIMGDDNHKMSTTLGGATYFNAPELTYEAIVDAMLHHRFYCSQGPLIHSLSVSGHVATIEFSGANTVILSPYGRGVQKKCFEGEGRHKATFEFKKDDGYIRFDLIASDGKLANTCAYFLDELK